MEKIVPAIDTFSLLGHYLLGLLVIFSSILGVIALFNLFRSHSVFQRTTLCILLVLNILFVSGFLMICWLHYQIHDHLALELPANLAVWLNKRLQAINLHAAYAFPLYDPGNPPRYTIPVWIENEKYYFWFLCYSIMAFIAHWKPCHDRFRAVLQIFLVVQIAILFSFVDPFNSPLSRFFTEISPWFEAKPSVIEQVDLFMRLYPKMIFYYNAHYMWFHPPLLFLAYASITLTFTASVFMLFDRDMSIEALGYDFAKFGYLMLTFGMLLGYPWALQAWGPNWWWDPKICSSIMMWLLFSTYLHARLYVKKTSMWYFSSFLGILCFLAMIFTFITSFYFPGEHTFQ